tara:strand:+ start:155177 stop:155662 length:486 start_codon:yes stop_codon:yes gene_type:complete
MTTQTKDKAKNQYQARLENQKSQLERHGNFAEVVIRTTPEGTDMINFARLWEHLLVVADRQTRGYIAKSSREDFEQTQKDFNESVSFMAEKLKGCIERHNIDLAGTNFISRIAQRYEIVERKKQKPKPVVAKNEASEVKAEPKATPAPAAKPAATEEVDGF